MSQQTEKTWEEERTEQLLSQGETRSLRSTLKRLLEKRFQTLPAELLQRIAVADADHLNAAIDSMLSIQSLDELTL